MNLLRRILSRFRPPVAAPPPERTELCQCGTEVPVSRAHIVAKVYDDSEGGTIVAAAYCPEHCPGGCRTHPEEHP